MENRILEDKTFNKKSCPENGQDLYFKFKSKNYSHSMVAGGLLEIS